MLIIFSLLNSPLLCVSIYPFFPFMVPPLPPISSTTATAAIQRCRRGRHGCSRRRQKKKNIFFLDFVQKVMDVLLPKNLDEFQWYIVPFFFSPPFTIFYMNGFFFSLFLVLTFSFVWIIVQATNCHFSSFFPLLFFNFDSLLPLTMVPTKLSCPDRDFAKTSNQTSFSGFRFSRFHPRAPPLHKYGGKGG